MTGVQTGRLLPPSSAPSTGERFEEIARVGGVRVEQIISSDQPDGAEQVQAHDEWVVVLEGGAELEVDGRPLSLRAGDWVRIPSGTPHRVTSTAAGTRWLALHADR